MIRKKYSNLFKDTILNEDPENLNSLEKFMKLEL